MIDLVERSERPKGGERAELRRRIGRLREAVRCEAMPAEDVAPVVEVAGNERRQMARFAEQGMAEQVVGLPAAFLLAQTQVPVDQVQRSLWSVHNNHLGTARLL